MKAMSTRRIVRSPRALTNGVRAAAFRTCVVVGAVVCVEVGVAVGAVVCVEVGVAVGGLSGSTGACRRRPEPGQSTATTSPIRRRMRRFTWLFPAESWSCSVSGEANGNSVSRVVSGRGHRT